MGANEPAQAGSYDANLSHQLNLMMDSTVFVTIITKSIDLSDIGDNVILVIL